MAKSRAKDMAEWAALATLIYGVHVNNQAKRAAEFEKTRYVYKDPFVLPPVDTNLTYHTHWGHKDNRQMIDNLLTAFGKKGVSCKIDKITQGATFTRIELKCTDPDSYKKLLKMRIDFRIAFNQDNFELYGEGNKVIINLPCKTSTVYTGDLLIADEFNYGDGITLAIGMGVDGRGFYEDLENLPHLLIAGSTGSGKTVLMHNLILSVLMKHGPKDVELYLIDPKWTEFSPYDQLGYCHTVSDPLRSATLLDKLCKEMDERYGILASGGASNIKSYNAKHPDKMTRKIVFIDELADLMQSTARKSVEASISRLSAKARAVGIHLVIATQYPTVKVITGQIKANITARISLSVATKTNSMVILDQTGAEKLLKHGDLYYKNNGQMVRLQAGLVDRVSVNNVVYELLKNQYDKAGEFGEVPKGYKPPRKKHPVRNFFIAMVAVIAGLVILGNTITSMRVASIQAETIGLTDEEIRSMLSCGITRDEIIEVNRFDYGY